VLGKSYKENQLLAVAAMPKIAIIDINYRFYCKNLLNINFLIIFIQLLITKNFFKMKKRTFLSVAAFAIVAITMASCAKDYTCSCTVSGISVPDATYHASKKDAQASCDAAAATYKMADASASCTLK
jgi:hypothetical protein